MNWCDRVDMIRRFYLGRDAVRLVRSRRAEAAREVERTIEDGFRTLQIDRGVALIDAYHEAGETDTAFEALRRGANALAVAAARLEQGREAIDDLILVAVRMEIEQMYDAGTAERLMVAFECGLDRTGRPRFRRA
jgi:hypothetical protein